MRGQDAAAGSGAHIGAAADHLGDGHHRHVEFARDVFQSNWSGDGVGHGPEMPEGSVTSSQLAAPRIGGARHTRHKSWYQTMRRAFRQPDHTCSPGSRDASFLRTRSHETAEKTQIGKERRELGGVRRLSDAEEPEASRASGFCAVRHRLAENTCSPGSRNASFLGRGAAKTRSFGEGIRREIRVSCGQRVRTQRERRHSRRFGFLRRKLC